MKISGVFQGWELNWLDWMFRHRLLSTIAPQVVIVGITEDDLRQYGYPLSDRLLAQTLAEIRRQQPAVIGLDIIRDIPVGTGKAQLEEVFQTTPQLIGAGKIGAIDFPKTLLNQGQVGDVNGIEDLDGVTRRAFLFFLEDGSTESTIPSLGVAVALKYLERQYSIEAQTSPGGWLQLKKTVFSPLSPFSGAYGWHTALGQQILINWWGPPGSFKQVSVAQVLQQKIPSDLFQGRAVLMGYTAESVPDRHATPLGRTEKMYGVEVIANVAASTITATLEGRPLIGSPPPFNWLLIVTFSALPALVLRRRWHLKWELTGAAVASGAFLAVSYLIFVGTGCWLTVIHPLMAAWVALLAFYFQELETSRLACQREVKNKTAQLQETLERLQRLQRKLLIEEKQAAVGRTIAHIAHLIRNPLYTIDLGFQIMRERLMDDCPPEEVEELESSLNDVQEQIARINALIDGILGFLKTDRTVAPFNLSQNILDAISQVSRRRSLECELKIDLRFNPEFQVEGSEAALSGAWINLLENAWDALEEKHSKIASVNPQLSVSGWYEGEKVHLKFEDNGTGIAADIGSSIFDPLFTTKTTGNGLGLSFARQIIIAHGGEIDFESVPEEGTAFTVDLPVRFHGS